MSLTAGTLSGVVVNRDGQPLPDVYIETSDCFISDVTDSSGYFLITDIPGGVYQIVTQHVSYKSKTLNSIEVGRFEHVFLDTIRLEYRLLKTERVIITATRTEHDPYDLVTTVNTVSDEEIKRRSAKTSAEALREESGIFIQKTNHGGGSAIIRGLSSNRILLLVDGIRLNNSTYRLGNHQYLTTVDFGALQQIEVLHGPGSVQYGSDALGGAINLVTKKPLIGDGKRRTQLGLTMRFATADQERFMRPEIRYNTSRFAVHAGLSLKTYGDLKRGEFTRHQVLNRSGSRIQTPSAFSGYDTDLKLVYIPSKQIDITYAWQKTSQKKIPRYDKYENEGYYKWLYDPQNRTLHYLVYRQNLSFAWIQSTIMTLSYQDQTEGRIIQQSPEGNITHENDTVRTLGVTIQFNSFWRDHLFTWGTELYSDRIDSKRRTENPLSGKTSTDVRGRYPDDAIYAHLGLFLQDEFQISESWHLVPGMRFSYHTTSFALPEGTIGNVLSPEIKLNFKSLTSSVGLRYTLTDYLRITALFSQGFRAPNLSDLSKLGESKSMTYEIPNTRLVPEKTNSIDLGLKLKTNRITAGFTAFHTRLSDLIASADATYKGSSNIDIGGTQFKFKSKKNIGEGFLSGFEQSLSATFEDFHIYENASYTYGQNTSDNEPIGGVPPFYGMAGIMYRKNPVNLEWFLRFASWQRRLSLDDLDDTRIPPGGTPGWYTLNFRLCYTIRDGIQTRLAIENIFDYNYREHGSGINGPGRNIILSLELMR